VSASRAVESECARVKIEIRQELTLERQGFDAHMRITNGLPQAALEGVDIQVSFTDADGTPVVASSDPANTEALFFIRLASMDNIDGVNGSGTVAAGATADVHWLIVPAPGASNGLEAGALYLVGAAITYTTGGQESRIDVSPDFIFVKPMPELTLDYFLPTEVYGDDAFTLEVEPPIPYSLGVRVTNSGSGVARSLGIESAQPQIVENELGLLIGFVIEGSTVNGQAATPSLAVQFGDLAAGASAVARWVMTCTLSGTFIEFDAAFAHADELGGELTSLIQDVSTHWLVRDVLVDLPGRDAVRDFLALDGDVLRLYESSGLDTEVTDQSDQATLDVGRDGVRSAAQAVLTFPVTAGPVYAKLPDPFDGTQVVTSTVRSDGKTMSSDNVWLSKSRKEDQSWEYFVNIFDVNSPGVYTVVFDDPSVLPQPPVLAFIPDRSRFEGEQLSFLVNASDPNGTTPALAAARLPVGAAFEDRGDGTGIFDWTPAFGQAGDYPVTFVASDGDHETRRACVLTVYGEEVFTLTVATTPPTELQFGFRSGATDAYDPGIDQPSDWRRDDAAACWFVCSDPIHPQLRGDFRDGSELTRWRLRIELPDDGRAGEVALSWDVGRADARKSLLLQRLEDESPIGAPMDMGEMSTASAPGVSVWEICYGEPVQARVSISKGWNLVGLPVMTAESGETLFAGPDRSAVKLGPLWSWRGAYVPLADGDPMNPERGYWVNSTGSTVSPRVTGLPADGLAALRAGWNLVSPVYDCVQPQHGRIAGAVWTWDTERGVFRALFPAEVMHSGIGYWLYSEAAGTVVEVGEHPLAQ
jgi:hypothetical protein